MDHFGSSALHRVDGETDGMFGAVEVVVDASSRLDEERSRDSAQFQRLGEGALKFFLYLFDSYFGCLGQQLALIFSWNY